MNAPDKFINLAKTDSSFDSIPENLLFLAVDRWISNITNYALRIIWLVNDFKQVTSGHFSSNASVMAEDKLQSVQNPTIKIPVFKKIIFSIFLKLGIYKKLKVW